jgi:hypothetical protein
VKRLIVNADDLGYAASIDAGIVRAHREGIVTASTMMANVAGSVPAAELARANPSLDVGVHLVLTHARPISDPATIPSLVDERGAFLRPKAILGTGRVRTEEALREYRAQFARARDLLDREPTHVDTHHWVQGDAAVFEAFLALARETGVAARALDASERDRLRAAGVRAPDRFRREFYAETTGVEHFLALLEDIAAGGDETSEVMCHPGEADAALGRRSTYARERPPELATLIDPRVRRKVDELGLVLSTFRDL